MSAKELLAQAADIVRADMRDFVTRDPATGAWTLRDPDTVPGTVVQEIHVDSRGGFRLRFADRTRALSDLMRALGLLRDRAPGDQDADELEKQAKETRQMREILRGLGVTAPED